MIRKILLSILIIFYILITLYIKPWTAFREEANMSSIITAVLALVTLAGLIICSIRMISKENTARKCVLVFNGIFLIYGCGITYFYWNFWIFNEPTFWERIQDSFRPFIFGMLIPIGLFFYFLHPKTKAEFKS